MQFTAPLPFGTSRVPNPFLLFLPVFVEESPAKRIRPELVIPDNLRSGVSGAHRYEPDLNPTYRDLASHYGVAVLPARVRRPRDKAKAEVAVQVVERWILAALRHRRFFSLAELNAAVSKLLDRLNTRPFRKLPGSRRSQFEQVDRPALCPLPSSPYVFAEWKTVRVHILCCDLSYVAKLSQPLGKPHGSEQLHNINESGMVVSLFTMRAHRWDTSPSRRPIATPSVDLEMKVKALQTCAVSGSDPLPEHTPNWHANSELPVSSGPVVLRIMWRTSPPSPAPMGDFVEFAT